MINKFWDFVYKIFVDYIYIYSWNVRIYIRFIHIVNQSNFCVGKLENTLYLIVIRYTNINIMGITIYLQAGIFISSPSYNLSGSVDNSGIILKEGSNWMKSP